jgi:hypothetical protein
VRRLDLAIGTAVKPQPRPTAVATTRPISLLPDDIPRTEPCDQQLAEVERRLDAAHADLGARATPKERFDQGAPDATTEADVKPAVADMFADAPPDFRYEVECRSRTCLVTTHVGTTDYDWVEALHATEYRHRWGALSFESNVAYLQLRDSP